MKKVFLIAAVFLAVSAGNAHAGCSVSAMALDFGDYDVFSTSPTDATASVKILCTNPPGQPEQITFTVVIGASPTSGQFDPRQMASGGATLNYNLFTDDTRSNIWGDGMTEGTSTVTVVGNSNGATWVTVYGRIPQLQSVQGGLYGDSLTLTIFW